MDEHLGHLAALEEVGQHLIGMIGVHVHLELGHIAHAQLAVAHGGQEIQRLLAIERVGVDEELVAVTVLRALPVVHLLDLHLRVRRAAKGQLIDHGARPTQKRCGEGIEDDGEAEAAGVHHAVLLEHGQQIGGALHRCVRLGHDGIESLLSGKPLLLGVPRRCGRIAQHREDSALHGLAHSLEGHFHGLGEGGGNRCGVEDVVALAALAQAAQDLGGDDAGVAAGSHERAGGNGLAHLVRAGADGEVGHVTHHALDGQRHVRARVAVGHGEHVQAVDLLLALVERLGGGGHGIQDIVGSVSRHKRLMLLQGRRDAGRLLAAPPAPGSSGG